MTPTSKQSSIALADMRCWTTEYCLEVAAGVLRDVAKREPVRSAEQLRYLADRLERRTSNQDSESA